MNAQEDKDEGLPITMYEFKENKRQDFYNQIKSDFMKWCGQKDDEFPIEYNWIFELIIKINHDYFGQNRVNLLVALEYNVDDETTTFYGLLKAFISNFNLFKKQLEFISEDSVRALIEKDKQKHETSYLDIINQFSNPEKSKNAFKRYINEKILGVPNFKKQFYSVHKSFDEGLEKEYQRAKSSSYLRGEVWIRFCKECLNRLFPDRENDSKVVPNTKTINHNEQSGFNLNYTNKQLKELLNKLIESDFLPKNTSDKHFINAFDGNLLSDDFKQLDWNKGITNLSLFIGIFKHKNKWKKAEVIFLNIKSGNLRKSYNIAKELDIHKSTNRQFHNILDSIGSV
ncbi:hypothetical protein [Emticicia sp. BO119]|uniref:hypothetical protein n=1 Tax=Emticicia sp. BO119 TaxID=2757768 RepID=UPI0015F0F46E|nr:hypothetical protein [Emticicia sp. BO119]MBA4852403.1 hypothetical protein [Emticicia sp. BO119]